LAAKSFLAETPANLSTISAGKRKKQGYYIDTRLPYAIVCFIKMTGYDVTPTVSALPLLCAKSSICWNPIIYVALNDSVS
jgi:hypothetical protein